MDALDLLAAAQQAYPELSAADAYEAFAAEMLDNLTRFTAGRREIPGQLPLIPDTPILDAP